MLRYIWCDENVLPDAVALACALWPGHDEAYRQDDLRAFLAGGQGAIALCYDGAQAVGFMQTALRHDYVEGTDNSPVGYLEGIYVCPSHRRQGVARDLATMAEQWAAGLGCSQMASDCELTNEQSLRFHLGSGFAEANRIICFVKNIDASPVGEEQH